MYIPEDSIMQYAKDLLGLLLGIWGLVWGEGGGVALPFGGLGRLGGSGSCRRS